jgi:replicative DNA helicase
MGLKLNLDEYESIIVYKALTDEKYLSSILEHLKPSYFKDKNIKAIFNIIKEFYVKRGSVPTATELKSYINSEETRESFKVVLRTFTNIDKNFNNDELVENTERYIKERAIYNTMLEVAEDIGAGKVDTSFILDKFEQSCNISLKTDDGIDLYKDIDTLIDDICTDQPTISTGWKWLDEKLGGGFLTNGRAIYVFAGETNIGKSIILGNIATNIAKQNKTVLLITLEMSELMYAKRLASNITHIPIKDLRSENQTLKQQIDEIHKDGKSGKIIIKEFPPNTITVHQLQGFIKGIISKGIKIDAVVVDYVNLVKATEGNNSYERVKGTTEQIRAMTYTFKCPFISATQLNRSGYDIDNPGLVTLSESMGLAATADVLVSIFQNDEERELGTINLGMMKNRFGTNAGKSTFKMDYHTLTMLEDDSLNNTGDLNSISNTLTMLSKG